MLCRLALLVTSHPGPFGGPNYKPVSWPYIKSWLLRYFRLKSFLSSRPIGRLTLDYGGFLLIIPPNVNFHWPEQSGCPEGVKGMWLEKRITDILVGPGVQEKNVA